MEGGRSHPLSLSAIPVQHKSGGQDEDIIVREGNERVREGMGVRQGCRVVVGRGRRET